MVRKNDNIDARITRLLEAIRGHGKPGVRWDLQLALATLQALRKLLPLRIALKDLHKDEALSRELQRTLPAAACSKSRVLGILRVLRHAGGFVDDSGEVTKDLDCLAVGITDDAELLRRGLVEQIVQRAATVPGGLQTGDAKALTVIAFGKGRPDFLQLQELVRTTMGECTPRP